MTVLESLSRGDVWLAVGLTAIGVLAIVQGIRFRSGPHPRWLLGYDGSSSVALSLPFGGVAMIGLAVAGIDSWVPVALMQFTSLCAVICGPIYLLGSIFWFPRLLLPRWYRRARRAGIERYDFPQLLAFRRLDTTQQRLAARRAA